MSTSGSNPAPQPDTTQQPVAGENRQPVRNPALRLGRRLLMFVLGIVVLLLLNAINNNLRDYVQDVIQQCGFAIILAVSLNIVNGLTGQFSIGHAGFMSVGAYTGASVTYQVAQHSTHNATPGFQWMLVAMVVGGVCAALAGYVVGVPSLRLRGDYLAIVTLGFGEIIRVILENITDIDKRLEYTGGAMGFQNIPSLSNFILLFGTVMVIVALTHNLKFSSHGLAFMSIREDEIAADAMGVNTTRIKVTAFVLSAFLAGVGGVLFAHAKAFKPDTFSFILSMNYVVMIVLGGTGSITGACMAAVALTLLPELLKPVKDQVHFTDEYLQVIYALILVLMMILRPTGVFGTGELSLKRLFNLFNPKFKSKLNPKLKSEGSRSPIVSVAEGLTEEAREAEREAEADIADVSSTRPAVTAIREGARTVLDVQTLTRRFGGLTAVGDVSLTLKQGELVGLIGPNGAGKTTLFNLLTGVYEPSEGGIEFDGSPIAGQRPVPSLQRTLLLAGDLILVLGAGYLISTILATAMVPTTLAPGDAQLQGILKLLGPVVGAILWFITMGSRRRLMKGLKPFQFAERGISRTFQNIRLFSDLTVLENVRIGTYLRRKTNLFDALFRTVRLEREEVATIARARELLSAFNLLRVENELARNLPYGDQRRLEIVRALATDPKLLLLDEPAAGMNPQEKVALMALIRRVRDEFGLTILLIEHDMKLVMGICERIYVLDYGRIIAEGEPQAIRANPKVIAAYLGVEESDADNL